MLRVAIAEDDFRIAQVQERFLLEVDGVEVVGKALNAKETLQMLKETKVDLLLLDIYMPDEMGTDLLPKIRAQFPQVDVIVVTAATEKNIVEICLRNGVVNYLIKPVMMESFINAIKQYQEKKELFSTHEEVDQSFIDAYFGHARTKPKVDKSLPSGIDGITLQKSKDILKDIKGITIEEMGQKMGVSRTTARRYLEYLVSIDECHVEYDYGIIGRPERKYYLA
ncbi:response regulator [Priestia aryabhattai]|uniref:response regulator n=1 Tax=Priestia megaterium TaxID=1404 RepID=UPI0039B9BC82